MRMLLINPRIPPTIKNRDFYLPSNLLCLAGSLQRIGAEVSILDLNIYEDDSLDSVILTKISIFQPSIVGLGCLLSAQFPTVLQYTEEIKSHFEGITIIIGGMHPTMFPIEILSNCPSIDFIVLSEGEEALAKLVQNLGNPESVGGIAYRKDGKVKVNRKTSFMNDFGSIPPYDLVNITDYYHDTGSWNNPKNLSINASLSIVASRGCPMRCSFCSNYMMTGRRWRARTPENVVDEIEFLYDKYQHRHFSFMDDNFTCDKADTLKICNLIEKRNLNIQFETPNGLSMQMVDEEILDALVGAGLTRVSFAIESGSDFIRNDVMKKRLPRKKIFEVLRLARKHKELCVRAFFLLGMPEDTRETLQSTYEMIEAIDVDIPIVSNLMPFKGSEVFEQALRDNLLDIDLDNLWKMPDLYISNKSFFLKPYNLELVELREFRSELDALIERKIKR